jgi:hypothetical protein
MHYVRLNVYYVILSLMWVNWEHEHSDFRQWLWQILLWGMVVVSLPRHVPLSWWADRLATGYGLLSTLAEQMFWYGKRLLRPFLWIPFTSPLLTTLANGPRPLTSSGHGTRITIPTVFPLVIPLQWPCMETLPALYFTVHTFISAFGHAGGSWHLQSSSSIRSLV